MDLSDKLLRLEKRLERGIERLTGRARSGREPFEIVPGILDDVEDRVEPTGGGGRTFPYNRLTVRVWVEPGRRAAARAVLDHPPGLEERIRQRLRDRGCEPPDDLRVAIRIEETEAARGPGEARDFQVDYQHRPSMDRRAAADPGKRSQHVPMPIVHFVVLSGRTGRRTHELRQDRIDIGRMAAVLDRSRREVRRNHLAFMDDADDPVNATVSRAHAHLEYAAAEGVFRLYDDDSAQGTRILRDGRVLSVPPRAARGVTLREGDEIEVGQARVRFELRDR